MTGDEARSPNGPAVVTAGKSRGMPTMRVARRDIYALLPPGERHPLATTVVTALSETAINFTAG
jgi:hypothetical protein